MDTIDILYIILLVALLAAFVVLWLKRMKDLDRVKFNITDRKSSINRILHEMNIKAEWKKEGDIETARYTYQGGHFNITLEKNNPFARVSFLFFYQTDVENIERVRIVCNLCNLNTDACRIVYTVDEKKSTVDLHLISVLPLTDVCLKQTLERVMGDAFIWQNTFSTKYEEQSKREKSPGLDREKGDALFARDLQLLHEQEMMHQEAGPNWHEETSSLLTLGRLVSTALGLTDIIPIRFSLTIGDTVSTLDDPDDILGFAISSPLIKDGAFSNHTATGNLDFYDPRDPITPRHLMVNFKEEDRNEDTLYYRVTLMLIPISVSKEVNNESERHQMLSMSVLLGYDLTPRETREAHFRYLWKEAMAKAKSDDQASMSHEEKVLASFSDLHFGQDFFRGRSLYLHKRYYEALLPLLDAFHTLTGGFNHHIEQVKDLIDEVAYYIGCCYTNLHQYDRACYYLQMILPTTQQSYTEAYVNCLVNGNDFRAMDLLAGIQSSLQAALDSLEHGEEDEDDEDHTADHTKEMQGIKKFMNFIKRRRAFLLINNGQYKEAEKILKQLLDDPDNSDYALSELAYIQKKK